TRRVYPIADEKRMRLGQESVTPPGRIVTCSSLARSGGFTVPEAKLNLLVLKTHDLPRLRNFYAALGLAFVEEQHGKGPVHFTARCGDLVLELYPLPEDAGVPDATIRLGFAVADLEATLQGLRTLGVEVVREPRSTPWGRQAVVRDPDGRGVELTEQ